MKRGNNDEVKSLLGNTPGSFSRRFRILQIIKEAGQIRSSEIMKQISEKQLVYADLFLMRTNGLIDKSNRLFFLTDAGLNILGCGSASGIYPDSMRGRFFLIQNTWPKAKDV